MLITVIDNLPPEVSAMLQAEYSRNHASIRTKLDFDLSGNALLDAEKIEKLKNAIKKWYVGYGHNSIGDCGTTTIFIENVSLLAAKVIQDNNLYNGQECSTRYISFSNCDIVTPSLLQEKLGEELTDHEKDFTAIMRDMISVSDEVQKELAESFKKERPLREGENENVWLRALNAQAFDVARGLLPAGVTTNLAWTGTLRNIRDNIERMQRHDLFEVRNIADTILANLAEKYPSTFTQAKQEYSEVGDWLNEAEHALNFTTTSALVLENNPETISQVHVKMTTPENHQVGFDFNEVCRTALGLLAHRPKGAQVPYNFNAAAQFYISGYVDFGGWRDLQRHRAGITLFPKLSLNFLIHPWYQNFFDNYLSSELKTKLENTLQHLHTILVNEMAHSACDENKLNSEECAFEFSESHSAYQYLLPIGSVVKINQTFGLASLIYMLETRTSSTVHPIVRKYALNVAQQFLDILPSKISLYIGKDYEGSIHRGTQTILSN